MPQLHQVLYTLKTLSTGDFLTRHLPITVDRFEHCNFKPEEVLVAFGLLLQASDSAGANPGASRAALSALAQKRGLK